MTDRDSRLAEAIRLRQDGHPEEARQRLLALRAELPDDAEVAYQTAWTHDTLGLEAEAVPHYVRALAEPDALSPRTGRARCSGSARRTASSGGTRRPWRP